MKKSSLIHYVRLLEKERETVKIFKNTALNKSPSATKNNVSLLSKQISGLYCDSRKCRSGGIFFCKGRHFLKEYLTEAIRNGAVAVIYEKSLPLSAPLFSETDDSFKLYKDCIFIEVKNVRKSMALLAAFHYGYPMQRAVTVAVTGTKGKTSTVTGIKDALNENPNFKAIILNDALPSGSPRLTTPEPIELHAAAARCIEHNATHIICEISSQGVKELRTYGIVFDLACFLNFGKDHVSPAEHPTRDDYFLSKAWLVSYCKRAVINLDCEKASEIICVADESEHVLINPLSGKKEIYTFSFDGKKATFSAALSEENEFGSRVCITEEKEHQCRVCVPDGNKLENSGGTTEESACIGSHGKKPYEKKTKSDTHLYINAPGRFNVQNALAVFSVCRVLGCTEDEIFRGVLLSKAEGRMEIFDTADGKVRVIVDYAHNKMSFEALFETVKRTYNGSPPKITAIFGCSGEKAYNRRYDLPEVALRHSDRIIICEDDSGREPFESIKNEILTNISEILKQSEEGYIKNAGVSVIQSREAAVNEAVKSAFENGERRLILFAGRGRENTMYFENGEAPVLSDVSAALRAIKEYDSRLSLDTVFSALSERRGDMITVSFENHSDIIVNLALSAVRLLRAGIALIAVSGEESAETLREQCYKNGIICNFISLETKNDVYEPHKPKTDVSHFAKDKKRLRIADSGIRTAAYASAKRGALTVATVKGDVKTRAAEISVREKSDALVYLTRSGGIILNGKPLRSVISEKNAALISEKFGSPLLSLACEAVSGGVGAVAVIDGRESHSLAFFGTGAGCCGTVIKKEKTKL